MNEIANEIVHAYEMQPPPYSHFFICLYLGCFAYFIWKSMGEVIINRSKKHLKLLFFYCVLVNLIIACSNSYFQYLFWGKTVNATVTGESFTEEYPSGKITERDRRNIEIKHNISYQLPDGTKLRLTLAERQYPDPLLGKTIPVLVVEGKPHLTTPGRKAPLHIMSWFVSGFLLLIGIIAYCMNNESLDPNNDPDN